LTSNFEYLIDGLSKESWFAEARAGLRIRFGLFFGGLWAVFRIGLAGQEV
jgi:hypothetical protein